MNGKLLIIVPIMIIACATIVLATTELPEISPQSDGICGLDFQHAGGCCGTTGIVVGTVAVAFILFFIKRRKNNET